MLKVNKAEKVKTFSCVNYDLKEYDVKLDANIHKSQENQPLRYIYFTIFLYGFKSL